MENVEELQDPYRDVDTPMSFVVGLVERQVVMKLEANEVLSADLEAMVVDFGEGGMKVPVYKNHLGVQSAIVRYDNGTLSALISKDGRVTIDNDVDWPAIVGFVCK